MRFDSTWCLVQNRYLGIPVAPSALAVLSFSKLSAIGVLVEISATLALICDGVFTSMGVFHDSKGEFLPRELLMWPLFLCRRLSTLKPRADRKGNVVFKESVSFENFGVLGRGYTKMK